MLPTPVLEEEIGLVEKAIGRARERGDLQKLLEFCEKALFLKKQNGADTSSAIAQLVESCNFVATILLQLNNVSVVYDLLKRALDVNPSNNLQKAITYNNLACFYRRTGKLRTALVHLEKAHSLELLLGSSDVSQTHLNLCATLSQLGKHDQAIRHAQTAVIKVYQLLLPIFMNQPNNQSNTQFRERVSVLCIAYFNLGVELEHLRNTTEAIQTYSEGLKWARNYLGTTHQISKILDHSIQQLCKALAHPPPIVVADFPRWPRDYRTTETVANASTHGGGGGHHREHSREGIHQAAGMGGMGALGTGGDATSMNAAGMPIGMNLEGGPNPSVMMNQDFPDQLRPELEQLMTPRDTLMHENVYVGGREPLREVNKEGSHQQANSIMSHSKNFQSCNVSRYYANVNNDSHNQMKNQFIGYQISSHSQIAQLNQSQKQGLRRIASAGTLSGNGANGATSRSRKDTTRSSGGLMSGGVKQPVCITTHKTRQNENPSVKSKSYQGNNARQNENPSVNSKSYQGVRQMENSCPMENSRPVLLDTKRPAENQNIGSADKGVMNPVDNNRPVDRLVDNVRPADNNRQPDRPQQQQQQQQKDNRPIYSGQKENCRTIYSGENERPTSSGKSEEDYEEEIVEEEEEIVEKEESKQFIQSKEEVDDYFFEDFEEESDGN